MTADLIEIAARHLPSYANAIVTTTEILEAICASPASSLIGGVEDGRADHHEQL